MGQSITLDSSHPVYLELNSVFRVSHKRKSLDQFPILQFGKFNNQLSITHKEIEFSYLISSDGNIGIDYELINTNIDWLSFYNRFFNYSDYLIIQKIKIRLEVENCESILFSAKEAVLKATKLKIDPINICFNFEKFVELNKLIQINLNVILNDQISDLVCAVFLTKINNKVLSICYPNSITDLNLSPLLCSLDDVDFSSIARHLYVVKGMLLRAPDSFFPTDLSSDLIQPYQIATGQKIHEPQQQR